MSEWKNYVGNRMIYDAGDFYVIKPASPAVDEIPLFCPLCDFAMNSIYDDDAYKKFECCDFCASKWAYPNATEWKKGWRPTSDEARVARCGKKQER